MTVRQKLDRACDQIFRRLDHLLKDDLDFVLLKDQEMSASTISKLASALKDLTFLRDKMEE